MAVSIARLPLWSSSLVTEICASLRHPAFFALRFGLVFARFSEDSLYRRHSSAHDVFCVACQAREFVSLRASSSVGTPPGTKATFRERNDFVDEHHPLFVREARRVGRMPGVGPHLD